MPKPTYEELLGSLQSLLLDIGEHNGATGKTTLRVWPEDLAKAIALLAAADTGE